MPSKSEDKNQVKKSSFIGVTKITLANIGLDKKTLIGIVEKSKGKMVPVARILGMASAMKTGETDKGEYVTFKGKFAANNYYEKDKVTGQAQEYRSGNLILPNVCSGLLEGLVSTAENNQEENAAFGVVFGYEILAKADEKAATGYVFSMASLYAGDDPLGDVFDKLPPLPAVKLLI